MSFLFDDDEYEDVPALPRFGARIASQPDSQDKQKQDDKNSSSKIQFGTKPVVEFRCDNCGADTCYYDTATGKDVCTECFTQSQQTTNTQQEDVELMDNEEVKNLAAKDRAGGIKWTHAHQQRKGRNLNRVSTRQPLEELDKSMKLPDVEPCLEGMQRVLKICAKRLAELVDDCLPPSAGTTSALDDNTTDDDDDEKSSHTNRSSTPKSTKDAILGTVGKLWISYLQAYADAAQHYGNLHPELRFSLRDQFAGYVNAHRVIKTIAYETAEKLRAKPVEQQQQQQQQQQGQEEDDKQISPSFQTSEVTSEVQLKLDGLRDVAEEEEEDTKSDKKPSAKHPPRTQKNRERSSPAASDGDDLDDEDDLDNENGFESDSRPVGARTVNTQLLQTLVAKQAQQGYKEAALKVSLSMDFIASLLWLAVCRAGITSYQISHWVANDAIPLLNANRLLSAKLKKKLLPVQRFFTVPNPPPPSVIEKTATLLAVACRMKLTSTTMTTRRPFSNSSYIKEEIRFWAPSSLPLIVANLVANAGLGHDVLNRSLALLNLPVVPTTTTAAATSGKTRTTSPVPLPLPLPQILADSNNAADGVHISKEIVATEDILAVIAIACLLDPTWRSWTFSNYDQQQQKQPFPTAKFIPRQDTELLTLTNNGANQYLDFLEQGNVLPNNANLLWKDFDQLQGHAKPNDIDVGSDAEEVNSKSDVAKVAVVDVPQVADVIPCFTIGGIRFSKSERRQRPQDENKKRKVLPLQKWPSISSAVHNKIVLEEPRRTLLLDFLAYSARADVSRIREKLQLFLGEEEPDMHVRLRPREAAKRRKRSKS